MHHFLHLKCCRTLQSEGLCWVTFWIHSLDLIGGLAGYAGPQAVEGPDPVGVPLALRQTRHLELQIRHQVAAGLPLVASPLAAIHVVAADPGATIIPGRLPGEENAARRLVPTAQVLRGVRDSCRGRPTGVSCGWCHISSSFVSYGEYLADTAS